LSVGVGGRRSVDGRWRGMRGEKEGEVDLGLPDGLRWKVRGGKGTLVKERGT